MRIRLLALAVAAAPFMSVHAEDTQLDTVQVTATPNNQSQNELSQASLVLSGEELDRQRADSLGETLAQQAGMSSSSYGNAVGRPVIRGMSGARVKVLQSGMEAVDASTVSPDHATAVHTHGARQIEVLRGPATLLYGNGAFGGVVNVVDDRVPHADDHDESSTKIRLGVNSVNDGKEIALSHEGKQDKIHWHVNASQVSSEDYRIPKDAGEIHIEDGKVEKHKAEGKRLKNSDVDHNRQLSLGAAYELENGGHVGLALSRMEAKFGLPGHAEEEEEEEGHEEEGHEEEGHAGGARVDLEQNRVDLDMLLQSPAAVIDSLSVKLALTDYEHTEASTKFEKDAQDLRAELVLQEMAGFSHVVGTQLSQQQFSASGGEALVPKTDTLNAGLFWLGETQWDDLTLELGARLDQINHDPKKPKTVEAACGFNAAAVKKKDFSNHSLSLGLIHDFSDGWQWATALTSAQRAPETEELFSCGAHESTQSFDIGNPDLKAEKALNLDLSLRKTTGQVTGALSVYRNQIDDFIFQNAVVQNGALLEVEELQAYRFQQDKATLTGAEFQLAYDVADFWQLTAMADTVRGKLDNGDYLPRMPADRIGLGVNFASLNWGAFVQHMLVAKQDRTATFGRAANGTELSEIESDSYNQLNAGVSYRIDSSNAEYRIDLTGTNLLNEEIRYHTSFVKNQVAQPGRGFKLAFNATF